MSSSNSKSNKIEVADYSLVRVGQWNVLNLAINHCRSLTQILSVTEVFSAAYNHYITPDFP